MGLSFVADGREVGEEPGLFGEGAGAYRSFAVGARGFEGTDRAGCPHRRPAEVGGRRNWL
ncbi:hypothetical protein GCM10010211_84130 [Streptomyces albospinus]|uniref:Uncharacterized protein n=1 Tax=Streptomyces albospinus TaxID=285515 RepID=A0ABQ2VPB5_9ACTN|nr:hypothetical protein [Streptomyces albospinus]GGV04072.1 hypothetical protein GCM10010211_84130 [Streptomyces albospinus]